MCGTFLDGCTSLDPSELKKVSMHCSTHTYMAELTLDLPIYFQSTITKTMKQSTVMVIFGMT
jgi:hypothetical protein